MLDGVLLRRLVTSVARALRLHLLLFIRQAVLSDHLKLWFFLIVVCFIALSWTQLLAFIVRCSLIIVGLFRGGLGPVTSSPSVGDAGRFILGHLVHSLLVVTVLLFVIVKDRLVLKAAFSKVSFFCKPQLGAEGLVLNRRRVNAPILRQIVVIDVLILLNLHFLVVPQVIIAIAVNSIAAIIIFRTAISIFLATSEHLDLIGRNVEGVRVR